MRRQKRALPSELIATITIRLPTRLSGRNAMSTSTSSILQEAMDGATPRNSRHLRRMKVRVLVRRPLASQSAIAIRTSQPTSSCTHGNTRGGTRGGTRSAPPRVSARPSGVGSFTVGIQLLAAAPASATACRHRIPGTPAVPRVQTLFRRRNRLAFAHSGSPIVTTPGCSLWRGGGLKQQTAITNVRGDRGRGGRKTYHAASG